MDIRTTFEDVFQVLVNVLQTVRSPVSVSYLNTIFHSRFQRRSAIDVDFMKLYREEFEFSAIGDDIKINLKGEPKQRLNQEYQGNVEELKKILEKDSRRLYMIKEHMLKKESIMSFTAFCKEFSSNKYKVDIAFINRNSHILKLKGENGNLLVEIAKDDNVFLTEAEFWKEIESDGFGKLVARILQNLFQKFDCALDIGKLQVCFDYGKTVIDATFMRKYGEHFELADPTNSMTKFKLKEEPKTSGVPEKCENNDIPDSSSENQTKEQNSKKEASLIDCESDYFSEPYSQFESFSDSESDSQSEDDCQLKSNSKDQNSKDSTSGGRDKTDKGNQNKLLCDHKTTAKDNKWESQMCSDTEEEEDQDTKGIESKEICQVRRAMEAKCPTFVFNEGEKDPVLIGFSSDVQERREQLAKLGRIIFREICKVKI